MVSVLKYVGVFICAAVVILMTAWGALAIWYSNLNLNYRTEVDFDVRYYDKTFDLNRPDSADLIAVYWMGDAIAHIDSEFSRKIRESLPRLQSKSNIGPKSNLQRVV